MEQQTNLVDEFAQLENERAKLEERLEQVKRRKKELEPQILDDWADRCVQKVTVAGRTVHIRNDFYCSKKKGIETAKVCEQLGSIGMGSLVALGYSAAALKSRVKEWFDEDPALVPEELQAILNYNTTPRLVSRPA